MNNWQKFLEHNGATFAGKLLTDFGETREDYPSLLNQSLLFDLSTLGTVSLNGPGVDKLLQGQVTCDMRNLSETNSLLGAQCTPKGRAITNFRAVKISAEQTVLILPSDQIDNQIQALAKYAPFFKVSVESAQEQWQLFGMFGNNCDQICHTLFGEAPKTVHQVLRTDSCLVCKISDQRFQILVKPDQSQCLWQQLSELLKPTGTPLWSLLTIRDGLADIIADTSATFIPQMLNLQAVGAISFKKGCYTGQEIVARMHYLGKLKRHMYRLRISDQTLPAAGSDCYMPEKNQSIGNIVCAAAADQNCIELLAVLTEQGAESSQLKFGDSEAQTIDLLSLPYSLEKV
jgi:folate-binding protein YgfZ